VKLNSLADLDQTSHTFASPGDRLKGKDIKILSMFVPAQMDAAGSIFHYSLHILMTG
jgi:hypothetical protein